MQPKKQEIFDHFLVFRLHTLVFSFISSGVSFILYGVLHIVVIRIVQKPFLLINHLTLTPVLLLYLIHIYKLLFDLHYPGSLTASNLTLGGSFLHSSALCIWMTTVGIRIVADFETLTFRLNTDLSYIYLLASSD